MSGRITSRMSRAHYDKLGGVNMSRLKELRRSPQHYLYALANPKPQTPAMTLGTACHTAVLEPERFERDYAIWERKLENGKAAPRQGGAWDAFKELHAERTILTAEEGKLALAMSKAVRSETLALKYLEIGDPEVTLEWICEPYACKGRIDWLTTIDNEPWIVGLKTARDCRPFLFGTQAARLGYHLQFAFYTDGFEAITGTRPQMVEIVVESEPPHAVAVYLIPNDIIEQGREEYQSLLMRLHGCEETNSWPGPVPEEQYLTLPSWAYTSTDDISDLGLELNA